jgi:hypothetical protein
VTENTEGLSERAKRDEETQRKAAELTAKAQREAAEGKDTKQ